MRKDFLLIIFLILLAVYFFKPNPVVPTVSAPVDAKVSVDLDATSGIGSISTTNYANTKLEYYYYIPKSIKQNKVQEAPFLVMVPGLSGKGEGFVTQPFKDFAKQNGFIIISPSFIEDAKNWDSQTSYQYPAAWSGEAFNEILRDFTSKQNISAKGLYLYGISAGAQFAERYSLLYPNSVVASAFQAPGGVTLPTSYQKTKFFVSIGTRDIDERKQAVASFYNKAKELGIDVQYKAYNCGHELSNDQINDSFEFFKIAKQTNN